ncbi:MAG: energy transducer TonB [Elusimicrobia bacterium]|nr:energy transducer TonB [Candidatus Liberimonas magnetica]
MNEQVKAFQFSIVIHAFFGLMFFVIFMESEMGRKLTVTDLNILNEQITPRISDAIKQRQPASPSLKSLSPKPLPERTEAKNTQPSEGQVPTNDPKTEGAEPQAATTQADDSGVVREQARTHYLKEQFTYIRDMIHRKMTYPQIARKMGWSGQVTISFVVEEDGTVTNIKIVSSSGFDILDRNGVNAIKSCSPYPKPPVRAEFVMPITYNLM